MPAGPGVLLDMRYHWVAGAARRLYAELDGAVPVSLCLLAASEDGEIIAYTLSAGDAEISRRVVRDMTGAAAAARAATIDVTPGDVPGVAR